MALHAPPKEGMIMLEALQSYLPSEWHRTVEFFGTLLWWIPDWQGTFLSFGWYADSAVGVILKRFLGDGHSTSICRVSP